MISRCFGAYEASAHSSNLGLPAFRDGVRGERVVAALGLDVNPYFPPRLPVRRAVEVYPHTATVALFGLATTLKYKAKPRRTLESRAAALNELVRHLVSLRGADPALDVAAAPRWGDLVACGEAPRSSAELARAEDELDAFVCAYTGLYYWYHGLDRCRIAGDANNGYILTPVTAQQAVCLDRQMAQDSVAQAPIATTPAATAARASTKADINAHRVHAVVPEARVTRTQHVTEFVVDGTRGLIVLVTSEAFELRIPTVEWTAGTHAPEDASQFWKRLEADKVSDAELRTAIEAARTARAAEFRPCRSGEDKPKIRAQVLPRACPEYGAIMIVGTRPRAVDSRTLGPTHVDRRTRCR